MNYKYVVFVVTLLGYSVVHIMRMTIPFVQLDLIHFFGIHNFEMGIANACLYIIIGLSYLWRAIKPVKRPQFTYFWSMSVSSLFYLITPLLIYLNIRLSPLFYLSLAGFGLFQSATWPVLLQIIHLYFKPRKDGCLLGFWSANGDIGNIIGFYMCTVFIYSWKLPFQVCLVVAGVSGILLSLAVYLLKVQKKQTNPQFTQIQEQGYTRRIISQYKQILKDKQITLMLLMFCMLKATLYGVLLWLPMYFQQSNFKEFQGYIPITMNIMAILGSIMLGTVYQKIASKAIRATVFMTVLILTVACFYVIRSVQFTLQNRFVLLILIGFIGFCVMGNFNILAAHEISSVADKKNIHVAAFSSLAMAAGNILVGILQFIIGRAATSDSNSVFFVFFVMSILIVILQIIRAIFLWRDRIHSQHSSHINQEHKDQPHHQGPIQSPIPIINSEIKVQNNQIDISNDNASEL